MRTLPRSLVIGTVLVMALYVLLNVIFLCSTLLRGNDHGVRPVVEVGDPRRAQPVRPAGRLLSSAP